ncbi:hypothetical protein EDD11_008098, partial [Mortierella claussenii]
MPIATKSTLAKQGLERAIRANGATRNHVTSLLKTAERSSGSKVIISMDSLKENIRQQNNIEGNACVNDSAEFEILEVQTQKGAILAQKSFVAIVDVDAEYCAVTFKKTPMMEHYPLEKRAMILLVK